MVGQQRFLCHPLQLAHVLGVTQALISPLEPQPEVALLCFFGQVFQAFHWLAPVTPIYFRMQTADMPAKPQQLISTDGSPASLLALNSKVRVIQPLPL